MPTQPGTRAYSILDWLSWSDLVQEVTPSSSKLSITLPRVCPHAHIPPRRQVGGGGGGSTEKKHGGPSN